MLPVQRPASVLARLKRQREARSHHAQAERGEVGEVIALPRSMVLDFVRQTGLLQQMSVPPARMEEVATLIMQLRSARSRAEEEQEGREAARGGEEGEEEEREGDEATEENEGGGARRRPAYACCGPEQQSRDGDQICGGCGRVLSTVGNQLFP